MNKKPAHLAAAVQEDSESYGVQQRVCSVSHERYHPHRGPDHTELLKVHKIGDKKPRQASSATMRAQGMGGEWSEETRGASATNSSTRGHGPHDFTNSARATTKLERTMLLRSQAGKHLRDDTRAAAPRHINPHVPRHAWGFDPSVLPQGSRPQLLGRSPRLVAIPPKCRGRAAGKTEQNRG